MSEAVDWAEVRRQWSADERLGYAWLAKAFAGAVQADSIRSKALTEGWTKDSDTQSALYGPAGADGYRSGFAPAAAKLALMGMDVRSIASMLRVSSEHLEQWSKAHPALGAAIKDGGKLAEAALVEQLHKLALGYSYETEETAISDGKLSRVPVSVTVPPNAEALLFLLSNPRKPNSK